MSVQVLFSKLHEDAIMPKYATPKDSGADLYANTILTNGTTSIEIAVGEYKLIKTGIAIGLPDGYEAQVRSRSGLAFKNGIQAHFGTIDNEYIGDVGVILFNHGSKTFVINHGDRIAQLIISPVVQGAFIEVEKLDETTRSSNGFGSSGTN